MQTKSFLKIWLLSVNFEKFTSIDCPYEMRIEGEGITLFEYIISPVKFQLKL